MADAFRVLERARGRRRGPVLVGAAVVGVAALGIGALLTVGDDNARPQLAAGEADGAADQPTTTSVDQLTPDQAFTQAAERLTSSGAFGYHGTTSATDVSNVRPGPWLGVEVTVIGQVNLTAGRVHELAVSAGNEEVAESVTDGLTLWGRTSATADELPDVPYETIRQLAEDGVRPVPTGAALLPTWLAATVNRQDAGPAAADTGQEQGPDAAETGTGTETGADANADPDADGGSDAEAAEDPETGTDDDPSAAATTGTGAGTGDADDGADAEATVGGPGARTFRATLPAAVLGQIEREQAPVDAEVRLTLDAGGIPVFIEIFTSPPGPPLRLALNISRIGENVPIDLPSEQQPAG